MDRVDRARRAFADLIHADASNVAVVSCASEAAFQVAGDQTYTKSRSGIVTTDLEFPSVAHVWLAAQARGATVQFVRHRNGLVQAQQYEDVINEETTLVSVPLVSYANGFRFPVAEVTDVAHRLGARVVVDAYQGAGVVPIDVRSLSVDYLIVGALKYLLGTPGIAFLWVRPGLEHGSDPALTGWFARTNPFAFTPEVLDYADDARRFQTGTPAIPAAYAAEAGISLVNETDQDLVFQHVASLAERLQARVLELGYSLSSPVHSHQRGPQVTVRADDADRLNEYLKNRGILASPRGQAVRLSLHYYNNEDDLDQVVEALTHYRHQYHMR